MYSTFNTPHKPAYLHTGVTDIVFIIANDSSVVPGSAPSSSAGVHHVRVRKSMDEKNKRRQLLLKARADRVRKKAEVS